MNKQLAHAEHDDISMLLPWYANGTLDDAERERVDAHLDSCGQCTEELQLCVEMLNATMSDGAIPIPPAASAAAIIARDEQRPAFGFLRDRRVQRLAATLAAVGLLIVLGFMQFFPTQQPNQSFNAVTGTGGASSVDYVLELQFGVSVTQAARSRVLEELGGTARPANEDEGTYAVVISLPPQSLSELEQRAAELAARDEIETAEFVALQVPVR
ncbi:MAG: zf-HC2 domain-containing protein [Gammaproteobacteria bacterium]|nr:zf-HC2 domain-containing protein [Gammaproteobacteria bacterium]